MSDREPFGAEWLAAQRWFRSKGRPVAAVAEADRAPIGERAALRILEVAYVDGGAPDRYLALSVGDREPVDGEGAWAELVRLVADDAEVRGATGRFVAAPTAALAELLPSAHEVAPALEERRLRVEQSNTSVVLGDRLILKLFRLLEAGLNPDLEVGTFLTEVGFADTPPMAGGMTWHSDAGELAAAAMLQALVPTRGDAWTAMLEHLAHDPAAATEQAAEIGRLTASLHRALASRPEEPDFPVRPASVEEAAAWRGSAERQLAQAVTAVSGEAHDRLVALAPAITARFADTFGSASGSATVSRIHGDYHLGQILARTDGGFSVIDFEGEPARPLAERRAPSSPLRDVAGLLRSLDYAARTAERDAGLDADGWLPEARAAFLEAYGGIGAGQRGLLDAFELEKACYEVRYEANNRPDWRWLPLAAVERIAAGRDARRYHRGFR
jgi:maltose alpha-D-glucosyltransferase/alpha-amylase